jgi:hypothetical protein
MEQQVIILWLIILCSLGNYQKIARNRIANAISVKYGPVELFADLQNIAYDSLAIDKTQHDQRTAVKHCS